MRGGDSILVDGNNPGEPHMSSTDTGQADTPLQGVSTRFIGIAELLERPAGSGRRHTCPVRRSFSEDVSEARWVEETLSLMPNRV